MKILETRILRGPNYWSTYRQQLIAMKLDLQELEDSPTNKIPGFGERLQTLIPSLYDHRCSEKKPGGFFDRVNQGTWMGHVIEHVALEIQSLADMPCGFGRTRSTKTKGIYHVVFAYQVEEAGIYAATASVKIIESIIAGEEYDINKDISELKRINRSFGLGPSTRAIVNEARKRKIPFKRLDNDSLIMLGYGSNQKLLCATQAGTTSSVAVDLVSDKDQTKKLLAKNYIPVPAGSTISEASELHQMIDEIGFPLVVKPLDSNHGKGVSVNIGSYEELLSAFHQAKLFSHDVIVERYLKGHDFRFLVINYKLCAVSRRTPAMIVGDNKSTIRELVDKINNDPNRGEGHERVLTTIKIDEITLSILRRKGLTPESVLPFNEILFLKDAANLSSGGTASDVTDLVHPHNVFLAERIARLMNLNICGIDIIAEDITTPINGNNGGIVEVNAAPGFRMHLCPTRGTPRNVAEPVIQMLFPQGASSRIPIVAVTGTNGKTTTTRLIAHFAKYAGHNVGFTTTDGIYIQDQRIYKGDCSGPSSAETVLRDPVVDFAVLECARGGILRSGLAFDKCDISIITNITEDHLGLNDIDNLNDLKKVKSVVARSTFNHGYAILNADDDVVYSVREELDCNVALFSTEENNERVKQHCDEGGWAAIIEKGHFTICKGEWRIRIAKVREVPLTMDGKAVCMIKNILPAILAGSIQGFDAKTLRKALQSFTPGPENTPGRMNIFHFRDHDVMIDYAHNTDGFNQMKVFLKEIYQIKVGIVGCAGDRRDKDIIEMGRCAAEMFDEIIIRHDKDSRGRTDEAITSLITEGIKTAVPNKDVIIISDEIEAIQFAKQKGGGRFIVVCSDDVEASIEYLRESQKKETEQWGASFRDAGMNFSKS